MKKLALFLVIAGVATAGIASAASLNVGSWHLWSGAQTLTKAQCTVTGASTDTFVNEASPSQTNGTAKTLDIIPDTGSRRWTFLAFDLTSCAIPATGGADSATLSLYLSNAPTRSLTLALDRATSSWSNALNWTTAQSVTTATTTTATTGTSTGRWISFTVTGDVDAFIKGGANDGWRITESGMTQNANKDLTQFASTDSGANEPKLVIDYEK